MVSHCMWHQFIGTHLCKCDIDDPPTSDLCHVTPQEVCEPEGRDRMFVILLIDSDHYLDPES